jgi:hypothetical protein
LQSLSSCRFVDQLQKAVALAGVSAFAAIVSAPDHGIEKLPPGILAIE